MAQNIYDKYGRKIGEMKSEEEALNDDWLDVVEVSGCIGFIIGGFLGVAPWIAAFAGQPELLIIEIPVLIATVIASVKIISSIEVSVWGIFWRIFFIDAVIGAIMAIMAGSVDGSGVLAALWIAVLPAAIVALIARKKSK